jgi:hypothetical protein
MELIAVIGKDRISRPTVFRVEAAESIPSMPVVRGWLSATEADAETRARVLALTDAVHTETVRWSELLAERGHTHQEEVGERERESVLVRNFQPTVIPGLLQTADYTRALIPLTGLTRWMDPAEVAAARQRRQEILLESGRRFRFLIAQHVLRWSPGEGLLPAQLEHIEQAMGWSSVEVAVLPDSARVATSWHNFVLHDRRDGSVYVTTELIHGTQRLADDADVSVYLKLWDRLWSASVTGEEALELIRRD